MLTTLRLPIFPALALVLAACGGSPEPDTAAAPATPEQAPAPAPAPTAQPVGSAPDLLARREFGVGGRPLGLVAHDFDGDGYDDLAVVLEKPGTLVVYAGTPAGLASFGARLAIGDFPTAPVLQGAHVLVGSMATGALERIAIARSDQGELVPRQVQRTEPGGTPRFIAASADATLWVTRAGAVRLMANGAGNAPGADTVRTAELAPDTRLVAGLVHPASDSVVLLDQGTRQVLVLSAADLKPRRALDFPGVPRSVAAGDVDGDGDDEAVVIGGDNAVWVFGLGAPGFMGGEPARLTQPNLVPDALHVRDLSGDGRAELISLGLIDQGYCVLTEVAPGGCQIVASEYAGQDPVALALGDFDGSGHVDLATACRAANAVSLWNGTGRAEAARASFAEARRLGVGGNPLSIAAADLWGPATAEGFGPRDGHPEIATLDAGDGMLSVLANDGFGTLTLAARWPVGPSPRGLRSIAGPGGAALVAMSVAPGRGGQLVAFRNGPVAIDVRLPAGTELPEAGEAQLHAADLDADGDTDLVLAATARPELWLLRNVTGPDGALAFEAGAPRTLDRSADAVTSVTRAGAVYLVLGLGLELRITDLGGAVQLRLPGPDGSRGIGRLVAADLTGDGRDDLGALWLGPNGTSPGTLQVRSLFELDGPSAPDVAISFALPTGLAPQGLAAADLNADGRDDFLVAAQNSHLVGIYLNRGSAGLIELPSLGVGLGPMAPLAVDLIGKGLVDILVANAFSADISVAYNRPR